MKICIICDKEIIDEEKHLHEVHLKLPVSKNNKGNIECPLCKVRVGNLWRHYFSELHRHNVLENSVEFEYTAEDFIKYYDNVLRLTKEHVENDEEHPFWVTAKEELDDKNFKKVREYIYGGTTRKRSNRRWNIKYRRPGRPVRRIKTNRKKIHKRGQNSSL